MCTPTRPVNTTNLNVERMAKVLFENKRPVDSDSSEMNKVKCRAKSRSSRSYRGNFVSIRQRRLKKGKAVQRRKIEKVIMQQIIKCSDVKECKRLANISMR